MFDRDYNESCNNSYVDRPSASVRRPSALPFPSLGAAREFKESRKEEEGEIQKEMGRRGVASYVPCCLLAANAFRFQSDPPTDRIQNFSLHGAVASFEVG